MKFSCHVDKVLQNIMTTLTNTNYKTRSENVCILEEMVACSQNQMFLYYAAVCNEFAGPIFMSLCSGNTAFKEILQQW